MPTIQFGGVSSGLDTASIISSLIAVESLPLTRLKSQATTLADRKTAYGTLGSALTDLLTKIQAFTLTSAGSARTATSSDATRFTAVADGSAIPGQYRVTVDRLASATRATSTAAVGTAITDTTATGTMSSLPLPGTVTAGQVGLAIDGQIVSVVVGDPTQHVAQDGDRRHRLRDRGAGPGDRPDRHRERVDRRRPAAPDDRGSHRRTTTCSSGSAATRATP